MSGSSFASTARPGAAPLKLRFEAISLFTLRQIGWTTFCGTPLAGAWLMRWNSLKLGDPRGARRIFWLGALVTTALVVAAVILPDGFPTTLLSLASVWGVYSLAKSRQGTGISMHLDEGGEICSSWRAARVVVVSLAAVFATVVAIGFSYVWLTSESYELETVEIGRDHTVYFDLEDISEPEVRRVGKALVAVEYFVEGEPADVSAGLGAYGYWLNLYLDEGFKDQEIVNYCQSLALELSAHLDNRPVDIYLFNQDEELKNSIRWTGPLEELANDPVP